MSDVQAKPKPPKLKLYGNALIRKSVEEKCPSRPMPTAFSIEEPAKIKEDYLRYLEAKRMTHVPSIFRGNTPMNYVQKYDLTERANQEKKQMAAKIIQRNYRKHLRDKRFIENRLPIDTELIKLAWKYKQEIKNKKLEGRKNLEEKQRE